MYTRRVRKGRTACLMQDDVDRIMANGRAWSPGQGWVDGVEYPPPDVGELVYHEQLGRLRWRCEDLCQMLKKPSASPRGTPSSSSDVSRGQLLGPFSELWEFLTVPTYADGTLRQVGTLSLKLSSGGFQVTLADPTSATYCCLTAPCLDDAFLAIECGLKDGSLAWRPSGYAKSKK